MRMSSNGAGFNASSSLAMGRKPRSLYGASQIASPTFGHLDIPNIHLLDPGLFFQVLFWDGFWLHDHLSFSALGRRLNDEPTLVVLGTTDGAAPKCRPRKL